MKARHSVPVRRSSTIQQPSSGVHRSMTNAQRIALQKLLFEQTESHTLGEAIDRYRLEHLHVDGLAPNTIAWREAALLRLDRWRGRDLSTRWRDVACSLYAELPEATASLAVNTLGRVLRLSARWGWRTGEPDLHGLARVRSQSRTATVQPEHRQRLLAALDEMPGARRSLAADVVRLILWTGMRVSEACGVEWDHVSLRERRLMLPKTKGRRVRLVPLVGEAADVVARQSRETAWVFPARDRRGPLGRRQPEQVMRDACIEAGIPHASPHVLRHTWATEAMRAGVPDEVASRAFGHASTRELQRYQHAKSQDVELAMTAVAAKLRGAG